jgi:preprotein translocase subunit YajC
MLLLPVLFGLFFFMVILPAQRKEKKQRALLLENLKKNDEVLTSSGIIGVVQNLRPEEDEVTVRIDDNCKVRMKKSSIVQIIKSKEEPSAAK